MHQNPGPKWRHGKPVIITWGAIPGGGVLRFAVIRGRPDFQCPLSDPKYFRQGANLGFN